MKKSEELLELTKRLGVIAENCSDVVVDLRNVKYHSDDEESYIYDELTKTKYMFKTSKDNPTDPVRTNAQRQFCKLINVPFQFFVDNRPAVRNQMVEQWLKAIAPEGGDEYLAMLKIREGGSVKVIRAILPISYSSLPLVEIVTALSTYPDKEVTITTDEESSSGMERDALLTHARILYENDMGGEYSVGVSITTSEVGSSDLIIDSFLYHRESKTYLIAQYGGQPFCKVQYARVQPSEVQEMLASIPSRLKEESDRYLASLEESEDSFPGADRSAILLGKISGAPKKLQRSMLLEVQGAADDMTTSKDFLRHAGFVAKDFDTNNRLKVERVIGSFGGLKYEKK